METSVKLTRRDELNIPIFKHLLNNMISVFGGVEITIKPKSNINTEILNRIKSVENGEELISFTPDEFDKLSQDLLLGKKPDKENFKKVRKDANGYIVPVSSIQ